MFNIEEIKFATGIVDKRGKLASIHSIYFPNGRLRLAHSLGPFVLEINRYEIQRFSVSESDFEVLNEAYAGMDPPEVFRFVQKLSSCKEACPGVGDKLIEFFNFGLGGWHISRGRLIEFNPAEFGLDQLKLDQITAFASKPISEFDGDDTGKILNKNQQFSNLCRKLKLSMLFYSSNMVTQGVVKFRSNTDELQSNLQMLIDQLSILTQGLEYTIQDVSERPFLSMR